MSEEINRSNPPLSPGECCDNGIPLPDPFLDYIQCPKCGEMEVELWCYEDEVACPICGGTIRHQQPECHGTPYCDEILQQIRENEKKLSSP